jgi:hypothetical protein
MPDFSSIWAGFVSSVAGGWAGFMTLISTLTPIQLLLGIAGIAVGLWVLKIILSPGGPRKRMHGMAAVWIMVPFLVAIGGVIVYFVIQILAKAPTLAT